jgi:NADH-quinone oxidoreductase subunit J
MMLDINFVALREGFLEYLPLGGLIGFILLAELLVVLGSWALSPEVATVVAAPIPPIDQTTNTAAMGQLIYTRYIYLFQAAGMILLVAMIGAIVLTHRVRPGVRKQSIAEQVHRRRDDAVSLAKVKPGQGI